MMSRTSNTHTIASIEPYEIGQDRSEDTTAPCMVLTVCFDSFRGTRHSSHYSKQTGIKHGFGGNGPPKCNGDLSATAVFALAYFESRPHTSSKRIEPRFD